MRFYNTTTPYQVIDHTGIVYTTCRDFDYISRYKGLRQVIHNPNDTDRFVTLEMSNEFSFDVSANSYTVPNVQENRLDIISGKYLGSALYGGILAYMNGIDDGYTVRPGQKLSILKNFTDLFNAGELLASVPPMTLNLGSE
jgi:hypothetical protein